MELIRSGFGDDIDHSARLRPIVGRKRAGFNFELPQSIGERERQTYVRDGIHIDAALHEKQSLAALPTGD